MTIPQQLPHGRTAIARSAQHLQQHTMRDLKSGDERLRRCGAQFLEGLGRPADKFFRRFAFHQLFHFLGIPRRLGLLSCVFNHMLRGHAHHITNVIKTFPTRAPRDLMEIPRGQRPRFRAAEFRQARQQHGADRHIHPHPERIGSADDF